MIKTRIFSTALSLTLLAGCASAPLLPERASGYAEKPGWTAKKFMVAAAHPLAVGAGYQVLRASGSAVDAAIAVQMLLTLVEPQSSGIGGGAFLLHFDGKKAFDGRETAPAAATESMFKTLDGRALPFYEGVVGAPGVLRMLELAHRQYGKLPWASLFALAIRFAEDGFTVSPDLARLLPQCCA